MKMFICSKFVLDYFLHYFYGDFRKFIWGFYGNFSENKLLT